MAFYLIMMPPNIIFGLYLKVKLIRTHLLFKMKVGNEKTKNHLYDKFFDTQFAALQL